MPTQMEYSLTTALNRNEQIKIELLNYQFQVVDTIQGNVSGQPSFNVSSSSDVRRTCSFTIVPTDSSFDIEYGSKIWLDKYVKIYKGIKRPSDTEYEWTTMGVYMINNPNQLYNLTTNTITINGVDLMAKLNGERGSQLGTATYVIPEGSSIRSSIISILQENNITEYVIEDIYVSVNSKIDVLTPYEIKREVGGTPYDLLKQLLEIVPNYQMYFDVNGVFIVNQIPNGDNEPIVAEKELFNSIMISYSRNTDYSKVKNSIQVFGKTHDIVYYGTTTKITGAYGTAYKVDIPSLTDLSNCTIIGFTTNSAIRFPFLAVNSFSARPIITEDGYGVTMEENKYYVVQYEQRRNMFILLGGVQPFAEYKETNPNSPFYVNGTMGEVLKVFSGGEYDNISSDSLALERAKYELYLNCRLQDNITITCVPIYWLDVNTLIELTLPNKNGTDITDKYIIKEISIADTQTITLMKYYPLYG